jgi:hypothetical protein
MSPEIHPRLRGRRRPEGGAQPTQQLTKMVEAQWIIPKCKVTIQDRQKKKRPRPQGAYAHDALLHPRHTKPPPLEERLAWLASRVFPLSNTWGSRCCLRKTQDISCFSRPARDRTRARSRSPLQPASSKHLPWWSQAVDQKLTRTQRSLSQNGYK